MTDGPRRSLDDDWLWGWDPTPGIVSVWADNDGRAVVWRRVDGALLREGVRYRPWALLASLDDLAHLGPRLCPDDASAPPDAVTWRELRGDGALRLLVRARDGHALSRAITSGASKRLRRKVMSPRELDDEVLWLPPEEQYLVATGRTHFRGMSFDDLRRLQFDIETTGLDPETDRVFLIAVRHPDGRAEALEAPSVDDLGEAALLRALVDRVRASDPDVIENHNLHGFDLPFLRARAHRLGVTLALGRLDDAPPRSRPAARGSRLDGAVRRARATVPGRELIDTLDAVRRHDFSARDLPGHGLKEVARHFGIASPDRTHLVAAQAFDVWQRDPARVRAYAVDDVAEAAGVARLLGGAAFALATMVPRRYERLADAGPATGVIDPLLVRAYLRAGCALPARAAGDGTVHTGAALYLFAAGLARRVVKADVASLYPSLMRQHRIGPRGDRLGVMLSLVDRLVAQRLDAKARAKSSPAGSSARHRDEALAAAMKVVVNSAYGYLGAVGLTRFSDVHAANEVTRRGRALLDGLCRDLAARGVTLLEADTDGVYFAVPEHWTEADERRVVAEVAATLPPLVRLEFEGRYAAMLSHEPKNYALRGYDGSLTVRGVAFRSSRAEPVGERFLRDAVDRLLDDDVPGVRDVWSRAVRALRARSVPTRDVAMRVRLTRAPAQYLAQRPRRRELTYEALLGAGRTEWALGDRVAVYRGAGGRASLLGDGDPRDYDVEHYVQVLRDGFATRLARAFSAEGFAALFEDPDRPSLFARVVEAPRLTVRTAAP